MACTADIMCQPSSPVQLALPISSPVPAGAYALRIAEQHTCVCQGSLTISLKTSMTLSSCTALPYALMRAL